MRISLRAERHDKKRRTVANESREFLPCEQRKYGRDCQVMSLAMADAEGCGDLVADSVGKCDQEIKSYGT